MFFVRTHLSVKGTQRLAAIIGADPEFLERGFRCVKKGVRFADFISFLAHLSRRLMDELIVYHDFGVRPSVRPSVVRPSTFSNIFSSETTGPIELKFHMETP